MSRAAPRWERNTRRIVRRQLSVLGVEPIDEQLVEPQVCGDCEAIVVRNVDRVGVRACLSLVALKRALAGAA